MWLSSINIRNYLLIATLINIAKKLCQMFLFVFHWTFCRCDDYFVGRSESSFQQSIPDKPYSWIFLQGKIANLPIDGVKSLYTLFEMVLRGQNTNLYQCIMASRFRKFVFRFQCFEQWTHERCHHFSEVVVTNTTSFGNHVTAKN